MPALKPTRFAGTITWLGRVVDQPPKLVSEPVTQLLARFDGIEGEIHAGLTRPSCSRVTAQYPRHTEIRNTRQLSILSAEELAAIAKDMGLETLDPALTGATMVIEGIPDFTHIPPGARLQGEGGTTLVVDMENRPCVLPQKPITARHDSPGAFKTAARGRRGITAWVEREGTLRIGERVTLHIPDQRAWAHYDEARRN